MQYTYTDTAAKFIPKLCLFHILHAQNVTMNLHMIMILVSFLDLASVVAYAVCCTINGCKILLLFLQKHFFFAK